MKYPSFVDSVTVAGYRYSTGWACDQKVYFATRFSKPFASVDIDSIPLETDGKVTGTGEVATFDYDTDHGEQLVVVTAHSPVSEEGALANLNAEARSDDFDAYRAGARDMWNGELSKVQVAFPENHNQKSKR